ncbi:hypothetical protein HK100_011656, partial [Physocladia obscura]
MQTKAVLPSTRSSHYSLIYIVIFGPNSFFAVFLAEIPAMFSLKPIVKNYKSQKSENAKILPTVEFNGTAADLKTVRWATATPKLKAKATVTSSSVVQIEADAVKIKNFAEFVVVLKNQRSYSFGG